LQGENDFPPMLIESAAELKPSGRLLAIDYGHKRLGIAVSNDDQTIASPLQNYNRRSDRLDGVHLQQLAKEYRIIGCVIGLPLHLGGGASQSSHKAQKFAAWFAHLTALPIAFHDERCTSSVVEERLIEMDVSRQRRKEILDKLAAQVILQAFIDLRQKRREDAERIEQERTAVDDVAE
jgi:putative Holliday junction resolvase